LQQISFETRLFLSFQWPSLSHCRVTSSLDAIWVQTRLIPQARLSLGYCACLILGWLCSVSARLLLYLGLVREKDFSQPAVGSGPRWESRMVSGLVAVTDPQSDISSV
jgi:hypothetical protein